MEAGTKVKCILAYGPLIKGKIYTVKRYSDRMQAIACNATGDAPIPGLSRTPGVILEEVEGYFFASSFKPKIRWFTRLWF